MGDEQPNRLPPSLVVDTARIQQGTPPNRPLPVTLAPSVTQPAMEFEAYAAQHFGGIGYPNISAFNMGNMANALPEYQRGYIQQPFQQQLPSHGSQNPVIIYQTQPGAQFAGQVANSFGNSFPHGYQTQFQQGQQYSPTNMRYQQFQANPSNDPQSLQNQQFYSQQPLLQQTSFTPPNQLFYQPQTSQYGASTAMRVSSGFQQPQLRLESNFGPATGLPYPQFSQQSLSRNSSESSLRPPAARGPPRKPKQSGHALWVGNLPPGTNIIDLKDHFSRDATADIESVFLISKSNCAFVNYKSESGCAAAMTRFHDSRFQGVRLVCRLRRGSTPTSATAPSDLSSGTPGATSSDKQPTSTDEAEEEVSRADDTPQHQDQEKEEEPVERVKEKFFIVKSLTIEDLEMSARNGIWATQAHNEAALNKAYQSAENVYLIFSANKSGEYFGYARMVSSISDETAANIEVPTRQEVAEPQPTNLPITIPTPATSTAPKGHIIDDSARGTIFWEADAELDSEDARAEDMGNTSGEGEDSVNPSSGNSQTFGKPFKITWISTDKLPFYRTRGLRNPWNANREVKIARDGTELEPSVGRRLTAMFHRPQVPSMSPNAGRGQMNMMGSGGYFPQGQSQQQPQPPQHHHHPQQGYPRPY